MAGETSLDLARLENVKHLDGGAIRAACPACRAAGSDKSSDHLLIQTSGKFGCATHKDDSEHRKEIFRLAGNRSVPRPADIAPQAKPRRYATGETFNWQKCVANFSEADAQKLAAWRGLSIEFVRWIHAQGIVGIFDGKMAFANHGDGGKVARATSGFRMANGFSNRRDKKPRRSFLATQNPLLTFWCLKVSLTPSQSWTNSAGTSATA